MKENNLFETLDDELLDLNGGNILKELGYWIGRAIGEAVEAVGNAKWHPYGPCGQKGCCVK